MATTESTCKVTFIGVWDEDAFTDDVMKTIAAYAQTEKGKKVKVTLNKDGIKISRSKMFQENLVRFYPYEQMKAVTKNPCFGSCIMLIMDGQETKYKIIALRCPSDSNSIYIVNRISQFRDNIRGAENVEFKKRDNGNWTLRERSAHNANMHLREIFKDQQGTSTNGDPAKLNGDIHHVPVLDKSKTPRSSSYIKRNGSVTRETVVVQGNDQTGELHMAVKDDGIKDAADLNELMEHVKVADIARRGSLLPSKPPVNTAPMAASPSSSSSGPVMLRANSRSSFDSRIVTSGRQPVNKPYYNQWASHKRFSGDFRPTARQDRKYSSGTASIRSGGSMRVQFDNASVVSVPHKTTSMRIRPVTASTPANFSTSTTIQRSIENTYGRPVVMQQMVHPGGAGNATGYVPVMSRQKRPSSVHVMSGNELRIFQHGQTVAL